MVLAQGKSRQCNPCQTVGEPFHSELQTSVTSPVLFSFFKKSRLLTNSYTVGSSFIMLLQCHRPSRPT